VEPEEKLLRSSDSTSCSSMKETLIGTNKPIFSPTQLLVAADDVVLLSRKKTEISRNLSEREKERVVVPKSRKAAANVMPMHTSIILTTKGVHGTK
jgi:hypothetical protein